MRLSWAQFGHKPVEFLLNDLIRPPEQLRRNREAAAGHRLTMAQTSGIRDNFIQDIIDDHRALLVGHRRVSAVLAAHKVPPFIRVAPVGICPRLPLPLSCHPAKGNSASAVTPPCLGTLVRYSETTRVPVPE